jgi:hypothetical protein
MNKKTNWIFSNIKSEPITKWYYTVSVIRREKVTFKVENWQVFTGQSTHSTQVWKRKKVSFYKYTAKIERSYRPNGLMVSNLRNKNFINYVENCIIWMARVPASIYYVHFLDRKVRTSQCLCLGSTKGD